RPTRALEPARALDDRLLVIAGPGRDPDSRGLTGALRDPRKLKFADARVERSGVRRGRPARPAAGAEHGEHAQRPDHGERAPNNGPGGESQKSRIGTHGA